MLGEGAPVRDAAGGAGGESGGEGAEDGFERPAVEDGAEDGEACGCDGEGTFYEDPVGCGCDVVYGSGRKLAGKAEGYRVEIERKGMETGERFGCETYR